jgi:hypothetical protein
LSSARLLAVLGNSPDFVGSAMKSPQQTCLWRLLRSLCTVGGDFSSHLWAAAEGFTSYLEGLDAFLHSGGVIHMLGILFGVPGYVHGYEYRVHAVSLLTKALCSPVKGGETAAMLRRFLPEPLVLVLRSRGSNPPSSLVCLDEVQISYTYMCVYS